VHRLGGFDATMLIFESAVQPMHACSIAELDTSTMPNGYSFKAFRDTLSKRTKALPEFRAKLADSALNLDTPVWVEDFDFDIDRHVHRIELPAPGGRRELSDVVGRLAATRLDRDRPLWDISLIEGVSGVAPESSGRIAAVIRTHHVFADGLTAGNLWAQMYSGDAAATPEHVNGFGAIAKRDIAVDGLARFARRPWYLISHVLPAMLIALFRTLAMIVRRQPTMSAPFTAPRIPFNGDLSERRTVAWARLDLEDVKAVKNKFGVKVNDVLLAVVAGAARDFLLSRSALPEKPLISLIPMSIFDEKSASRNQFAPIWSSLHTHVTDPADRLKAIAASSSVAKEHSSAIGSTLLIDVSQFAPSLPPAIMRLYARVGLSSRRPVYNVSLSNVVGVQGEILGARIIANYPFGPVMNGAGLNVTAASLDGNIDFGLISCPELMPDLWDLAEGFPVALKELMDASP
jgi:diacylglycerol O-acyltransferase / wax synthase